MSWELGVGSSERLGCIEIRLDTELETPNPKLATRNPKPETPNSQLSSLPPP